MIRPTGQLIIFGQVGWETTGKKEPKRDQKVVSNIYSPHRFKDYKVRYIISGCVAAHSVAVNDEGQALTFGKLNI